MIDNENTVDICKLSDIIQYYLIINRKINQSL